MHLAAAPSVRSSDAKWLALAAALALATLSGCARSPLAPDETKGSSILRAPTASPSPDADYAPGRVIVRLREGVAADVFAASYRTTALSSVPELRLYLLSTTNEISEWGFVRILLSDPRVEFAEVDFSLQTAEGRQSTMAFDEGLKSWTDVLDQGAFVRLSVPEAHAISVGQGVLVAVLDTGVDLDHPALWPNLELPGFEPGVATDPGDDRPERVDSNGDGVVDGALGHGTHVAGLILGVAPGAHIYPVRVLNSDGVGYAFAVARGIVTAVQRGASVANLSLGMNVPSLSVAAAVDYACSFGTIVLAPSGNSGLSQVEFPAAYDPVIAVAGTAPDDHKAAFSNYGSAVDVAAPAVGILSTYVGGGYASWSGTSMAAPFASGIACLLYESQGSRSTAAATHVGELLRAGALPLASIDSVYGSAMGTGRVSALGSLTLDSLAP